MNLRAVQTPPTEDRVILPSADSEQTPSSASPVRPPPARPVSALDWLRHRGGRIYPSTAPGRRRSLLGVLGLILLLAATSLLLANRSQSASPGATEAVRGTLAIVQTGSAHHVVVHSTAGPILTVLNPRILTSDGSTLPLADLRPGDAVAVQGDRMVDLSQSRVSVQGLVAVAPEPLSSAMIVQLRSGMQIVVDFASTTRINGVPASRTSPLLIMDVDSIHLVGVFDAQLGEMTQTESIAYATH
jgi:hypothetical protein